jgi:tetratricopeptide (TPR) repeat protein
MSQPTRDQVFISYSHKDKKWLEKLQTMLAPLVRKDSISVWDDTMIKAGAKRKEEIEGVLAAAKVAVLLVSPHFLASHFIVEHQVLPLLKATEKEGLVILWVYVSNCLYDETEIKDYQAAHDISKPLDSLPLAEQARELANVCRQIKAAANPSSEGAPGAADYILSGYVIIASLLQLREASAHDQMVAVEAVKHWLSSHQCWLLILDNADDLTMVAREFIPAGKNGHVLLTTRARAVGAVGRLVEVQEMKTGEATLFLLRRAKYIVEDALLQAAASRDQQQAKETDEVTQRLWAERAVRAVKRTFPDVKFSTWALCERLISQAHACAELINQWRLELPEGARLLNAAGHYLYKRCRYTDAEPLMRRALGINEKNLGSEHPDVARDLNNLAWLLKDTNRQAEAERLFRRALAINEKVLGPEHPDVATSLNNLALLYDNLAQHAKAEPLYERAVGILEKVLGSEHPDVAWSLNRLAELYRAQGQYAKAQPLHERALAIREKILGLEHSDVAWSLNGLARLDTNQGRYAEAEPLLERALAIREKALGQEHRDVAETLNDLAALYCAQGQYTKAEPLYQRALAIRERALGPEHPDVAQSLNGLAGIRRALGQQAEAEALYKRGLAIREKALGPEHPDLAWSLNDLAALYAGQGQYAKAEPLYQRALVIREKALGPVHPDLAWSLNDLAALYADHGQYTKAEPLYERGP